MRKSTSLSTLLLSALLLLAAPVFGITKNWVDDSEHPFVGLAVFYDSNGDFLWRCSGSLISPTKFLTAGHCADTAEGAVTARVYFQQDAGAHYDPATELDPVTGYPESCALGTLGKVCATVSAGNIHNYGFANFTGFPNTHDVGLLLLDQPISLSEYGQLPAAGQLDNLGTARGKKDTVFTVSGYGLSYSSQDHSAVPSISFRIRLMANSTLVNLNSAQTGGYNVQTQGNGKRPRWDLLR